MMKSWLVIVAAWAALAGGQAPKPGAVPERAGHMHVTVEADRVRIGPTEFVPRLVDRPNVLIVPAGRVVTLPPDSTWDTIEVAGTLVVSRTHDTTVRFVQLTILPGGRLDAGTEADPVLRNVEFIVRDVPVDVARDPFQWGNGLLNFGTQTRVGRQKARAWTELAEDAEAGAAHLTLAEVPEGWQVGDELLLPDMRQPGPAMNERPPRRGATLWIAAIKGAVITLSRPLDFERRSIVDPNGRLVVRPRVANLTRNIVIRSENPAGVRGHTVNIGPAASWDIRYNQFIGLGRTRNEDIDNTPADGSRVGTNQIGKYADHDHHAQGFGTRSIGNTYLGLGQGKWAHAVHATHDSVVEDNVCVDFPGGCFVTEDGYEIRNVFRRNVAAYSAGNGMEADANLRGGRNCPGCEGSGFWFRGLHQVIEANESWNNASGLTLFSQNMVGADHRVPGEPGGDPDTAFDSDQAVPLSFRGNVTIGNRNAGLEYWGVPRFPADDHLAAHNGRKQVWAAISAGGNNVHLRNVRLIASGAASECLSSSVGYITTVEVDGGEVRGCRIGVSGGLAIQSALVRNVVLQNWLNLHLAHGNVAASRFEDIRHEPLGTFPKQYVWFDTRPIWQPGEPFPKGSPYQWTTHQGARHSIVNWQGTGQDYVLVAPQQLRSTPAWPAIGPENWFLFFVPDAGLTMGEAWDRFGMAYGGHAVADDEAVPLDGLVNVLARSGLDTPLGMPRAVLTVPNMLSPAKGENGFITLYLLLTGEAGAANDHAVLSVDGGKPVRLADAVFSRDQRRYRTPAVSPGIHEVRTWRETPSGDRIPASEMTFRYLVVEPSGKTAPERARKR